MNARTVQLVVVLLWLVFAYAIGLASFEKDKAIIGGLIGLLPLMLAAEYLAAQGKRKN